jgi:hypothetical protein
VLAFPARQHQVLRNQLDRRGARVCRGSDLTPLCRAMA